MLVASVSVALSHPFGNEVTFAKFVDDLLEELHRSERRLKRSTRELKEDSERSGRALGK